ncbi:DUF4232 domain-containing protein [Streptomyces griseoviridis]
MSSTRTSRTRLLAAAAATVVVAGLSLTACGGGTGVHDEGAAKVSSGSELAAAGISARPTSDAGSESEPGAKTESDAKTGAGSSAVETASLTGRPAAKAPAKGTATKAKAPAAAKSVTCEGSTTKTVAAPLSRPLNHLLLTVTNTGSKNCDLYYYPAVQFGQSQSVPPAIEDSMPQAVVTLAPGKSGYAAVILSAADGSGKHGYTSKSLDVYFMGRDNAGSVGKGAHPALPAKGVYVDDSVKVTYWQQKMEDAINW